MFFFVAAVEILGFNFLFFFVLGSAHFPYQTRVMNNRDTCVTLFTPRVNSLFPNPCIWLPTWNYSKFQSESIAFGSSNLEIAGLAATRRRGTFPRNISQSFHGLKNFFFFSRFFPLLLIFVFSSFNPFRVQSSVFRQRNLQGKETWEMLLKVVSLVKPIPRGGHLYR